MNLEKITNQLKKFKAVNSSNPITSEEQWRKEMMLQQIDRDLKKLRKKLI